MKRSKTIRYRCAVASGGPMPGSIVMGDGPRVKRAYLVLSSRRTGGTPALGMATFLLTVESMSASAGREKLAEGYPRWNIVWFSRRRNA